MDDPKYIQTQHAFTPFYGTNHKFNGWMDYFYVGNHGGSVGLNDIYLKATYKKNKFNTGVHVHYFMAAADVFDAKNSTATETKAMSSGLGTEIDWFAGYKLDKNVTIKGGISMMLATETMHVIKNSNYDVAGTNYWGWMMIVVKPTLFKSEKK